MRPKSIRKLYFWLIKGSRLDGRINCEDAAKILLKREVLKMNGRKYVLTSGHTKEDLLRIIEAGLTIALFLVFTLNAGCVPTEAAPNLNLNPPDLADPIDEEPPIEDPPAEEPPADSPPEANACSGNYLAGIWTTASDPEEIWLFNDDCTGYSYKCEYEFSYPAEGDTTGYGQHNDGWSGSYNFSITHVTGPNQVNPGCEQYNGLNGGQQWHWCNILPDGPNRMRMDCNGEANSFYFDRSVE